MTRKELYEKIRAHVSECRKCQAAETCDRYPRCGEGGRLNRAYEQAELEHRDEEPGVVNTPEDLGVNKCPDCGGDLETNRVRDIEYAADILITCTKKCGYMKTAMAEDYATADTTPSTEDLDMTQLVDPNETKACLHCGEPLSRDVVLKHGREILTAFLCRSCDK